jgi:hypothetical protein
LNYIGSCDTSSSQLSGGSVLFSVIFDGSMNFLMAEYLLQVAGSATVPANLISGFLHTETCVQSGIANQYTIPIPVAGLDSSIDYTVKVRIYDSASGDATEWSNILTMHLPPAQPVIDAAYYDSVYGYGNDVLYVIFDAATFDASNQAIIAYYYTDLEGNVKWEITSPTDVLPVPNEAKFYVMVPLENDVALDQPIYVAANQAYYWTDVNDNTHYAISEVSLTVEADAAEYGAPTLTSLEYNVYTTSAQSMTLTWTAPTSADLGLFIVDHYLINKFVNGVLVETIDTESTATQDTVSVSTNTCGQNISFTVRAVSTSGVVTNESNSLSSNIFTYSTAPTNLEIGYAFITDLSAGTVDIQFAFNNPTGTGCGVPDQFECVLKSGATVYDTLMVDYHVDASGSYIEYFNNVSMPSVAELSIEVSLCTTNTNPQPPSPLYGATATTTYVFTTVPVITNIALNDTIITFTVLTPTLLDLVNNVTLLYTMSIQPTNLHFHIRDWFASSGPGGNVLNNGPSQDANGIYIYNVEVDLLLLPTPDRAIIVNASNGAGIGHAYLQL